MGGLSKMKNALKKGYDCTGCKMFDNLLFNKLLAGMLEIDPEKRMSPEEILESEFINNPHLELNASL